MAIPHSTSEFFRTERIFWTSGREQGQLHGAKRALTREASEAPSEARDRGREREEEDDVGAGLQRARQGPDDGALK